MTRPASRIPTHRICQYCDSELTKGTTCESCESILGPYVFTLTNARSFIANRKAGRSLSLREKLMVKYA